MHCPVPDFAGEVASALQKDHRIAGQEAGESVAVREVGEHKEAIAGNTLKSIDLVTPVASTEFQLVAAIQPREPERSNVFWGVHRAVR